MNRSKNLSDFIRIFFLFYKMYPFQKAIIRELKSKSKPKSKSKHSIIEIPSYKPLKGLKADSVIIDDMIEKKEEGEKDV